jgi:hypothetical protein
MIVIEDEGKNMRLPDDAEPLIEAHSTQHQKQKASQV